MSPEEKLRELGITLPPAPTPLGSYVPAVTTGSLVYLSGMLPLKEGKLAATGKLGSSVNAEHGAQLARICAVNALSVLKAHIGDLSRVSRCVRVCGYVASEPSFTSQPAVLNGASDLLAAVFGPKGVHARSAVGVGVLPLDSPVEIEFVFEVDKEG